MSKKEARELEDQKARVAAAKARKAATMSPAEPPKHRVAVSGTSLHGVPYSFESAMTDAEIASYVGHSTITKLSR